MLWCMRWNVYKILYKWKTPRKGWCERKVIIWIWKVINWKLKWILKEIKRIFRIDSLS
jgi:hypothetical protein